MKAALLIAAALAVGPALAGDELVMRTKELTVRLTMEPCEIGPLIKGLDEAGTETPARKAYIQVREHEVHGCWGTLGDKVLIGDETGAGGYLLKSEFGKADGV